MDRAIFVCLESSHASPRIEKDRSYGSPNSRWHSPQRPTARGNGGV